MKLNTFQSPQINSNNSNNTTTTTTTTTIPPTVNRVSSSTPNGGFFNATQVLTPAQAESRRVAAILQLEIHLNEVVVKEEKLRKRLAGGIGVGVGMQGGGGGERGGGAISKYEMSAEVKKIEEELKRYEEVGGYILTATTTPTTVPTQTPTTTTTTTPTVEAKIKTKTKTIVIRKMNIDVGKDFTQHINKHANSFKRQREIAEASLLSSGMQQYQIVELLAENLAEMMLSEIQEEVEGMVGKDAERLFGRL